MIYFVAAVAGIAGILFGFDEGIIAGALSLLRGEFGITPLDEGLMTAAVPFGALFGALIAGRASERFGRRALLLWAAILFILGAVFSALITAIWMLSLARLMLGVAVGVAALVAPLYISESAPPAKRGMLVSIYQLAITLGILSAYLVSFAFDHSWSLMFMMGALPGIALFFGMYVLHDTPRWLALKGRQPEARAAMARLHGVSPDAPAITAELADINRTAQSDRHAASWADLLTPSVRPALIVSVGLFLLQQLSGINAVIYYAPTVFKETGFDSHATQILATIGVGVVNVAMTVVGMMLIDRIGRRRLLLIGFAGTALSLGLIAVGAVTEAKSLDMLALGGLVLYIAAFAASIGPLPWVMMSEIFPLHARGLGMSVASLANWGFNFIVVFSFPVLVSSLGLGGVFAIYTLACLIGILFTLKLVPETNGVSLEEIERHLKSGRPLRLLGQAPHDRGDQAGTTGASPGGLAPRHDTGMLIRALISLGPYQSVLMPLADQVTRIALENHQVRGALQSVSIRTNFENTGRLSATDLGSEAATLKAFLEHVRFASPAFLESVGELPAGGKRG
ncbi:sugar porter family MFS transporter [Paralcaligenes sp. KSB-10]|uniref:sugar porter family MFS transporter n=1 Tax=Paralcaligenes sp. KSB-10 TaxID=2901142 RepID=UPI001E4E7B07|nr:sugar porter family MFS transporter [Paralcaligenes sp. KSB-10]UHL65490.1 sugar porter family MFS transporter [Paralcaligenes sp. KSB-10]